MLISKNKDETSNLNYDNRKEDLKKARNKEIIRIVKSFRSNKYYAKGNTSLDKVLYGLFGEEINSKDSKNFINKIISI